MNAGSAVLQMTTGVSKHLVQVLQFIVVLVLAAQFSLTWMDGSRRRRDGPQKGSAPSERSAL